jgi:hypothetical protein
VKVPAADATDAPQAEGLLCNPEMKMISFLVFPCIGARVGLNWRRKTEVLEEKPVPVPLCPLQISHILTGDRTQEKATLIKFERLTKMNDQGPFQYPNVNGANFAPAVQFCCRFC